MNNMTATMEIMSINDDLTEITDCFYIPESFLYDSYVKTIDNQKYYILNFLVNDPIQLDIEENPEEMKEMNDYLKDNKLEFPDKLSENDDRYICIIDDTDTDIAEKDRKTIIRALWIYLLTHVVSINFNDDCTTLTLVMIPTNVDGVNQLIEDSTIAEVWSHIVHMEMNEDWINDGLNAVEYEPKTDQYINDLIRDINIKIE